MRDDGMFVDHTTTDGPTIKGGQGRTRHDIEGDVLGLEWLGWLMLAAVAATTAYGLWRLIG